MNKVIEYDANKFLGVAWDNNKFIFIDHSKEQVISIAWEVAGTSAAPANIDRQATSNGNIWATGATSATPIMIACYTSRLEISAGRNVLTFT